MRHAWVTVFPSITGMLTSSAAQDHQESKVNSVVSSTTSATRHADPRELRSQIRENSRSAATLSHDL